MRDISYKDEPCRAYKQAVGQENEDARRQQSMRRKERDLGSNQAPMREWLGRGVGCVFLAVFLAVSTRRRAGVWLVTGDARFVHCDPETRYSRA